VPLIRSTGAQVQTYNYNANTITINNKSKKKLKNPMHLKKNLEKRKACVHV